MQAADEEGYRLAGMAKDAIPYLGIVMAVIILLIGHSINLILGVMGGVIHGLRLNSLEWYRWSFEGDGLPAQFQNYTANGEPVDRGEPLKGEIVAAAD